MKKILAALSTAIAIACMMPVTAFASAWLQGADGRWWYQHDDGSYTKSGWEKIDGKDYYFDADGWMLSNTTTPDGYQVGADGAWIQNLTVNTTQASTNSSATGANNIATGSAASIGYTILPYTLLPFTTTEVFESRYSPSTTTFTITSVDTYATADGSLGAKVNYKVNTYGDTPSMALIGFEFLNADNVAVASSSRAIFEGDSVDGPVYGSKEFVIPASQLPKGTYRLRVFSEW